MRLIAVRKTSPSGAVGADNTIDTAFASATNNFVYDTGNARFAGKVNRSWMDVQAGTPLTATHNFTVPLEGEFEFAWVAGTAGGVYIGHYNFDPQKQKDSFGLFIQSDAGGLICRSQAWTSSGRGEQFGPEHFITNTPPAAWVTATAYVIGNIVINSSSKKYTAKTNHTSAADTEPGIGANWAANWTDNGVMIVPALITDYHKFRYVLDPTGNGGRGTITWTVDGLYPLTKNLAAPSIQSFMDEGCILNMWGVRNIAWYHGADITFRWKGLKYYDNGVVKTVDLATDPGFTMINNNLTYDDARLLTNQDFGFRGTAIAGLDGSDIGGFIIRKTPNGVKTYWGVSLPAPMTLDNRFRFRLFASLFMQNVDSVSHIGWFLDATQAGGPPGTWAANQLGIMVGGSTNDGHRMRGMYVTSLSEIGIMAGTQIPLGDQRWLCWGDYNPDIGNGRLTVNFRGVTSILDLTAGHRASGASFDRFGIYPQNLSGGGPMEIYYATVLFDDKP